MKFYNNFTQHYKGKSSNYGVLPILFPAFLHLCKISYNIEYSRSSPAGTVTHDDILDITEALAEDGR